MKAVHRRRRKRLRLKMGRRPANDLPVPQVRARSRGCLIILALLGALMTHASGAQEAAPPAGGAGTEAEPIDTRITVQSGRATKPGQNASGAKAKSGVSAGQQAPRVPSEIMTPNAVGFPVSKGGAPQAAGSPGGHPPDPQPGARLANPNFSTGSASAGERSVAPAALNHATISGTGITHLGAGPGIVRGTPKSLGAVNGTNFQRKR